ncbi:hypothetical protein L207DRAFT_524161 [Hyaloscypha variabilis F]|uniref:MYND-type domain-containing protein n=1 Tax=Hyaloscypha variabilis (strain UAMH 11265 / GT02V1 / F) TaxID=1149755 RepID=A0A2J6S7S5_HYAVF|nr:hypothetical protein L207DRAFT_524161 [Hyaloscypha variabilis F]
MASTTPQPKQTCVVCQKTATQRCNACKLSPRFDGTFESIYYCMAHCQKADWKNHKKICNRLRARKSLQHAAHLLQEIFYIYREKIFDKYIVKIDKKHEKLYIHEGLYPESSTAYEYIMPFPYKLFHNESDKRAVLVHWACDDAVGWMQEVVEYVLADIVSQITELIVKPKNNKRVIIAIAVDGEEQNAPRDQGHSVWKVTLKTNKEDYVLDFSSAQFGYYEPVTPFGEYLEHRVQESIFPGGPPLP